MKLISVEQSFIQGNMRPLGWGALGSAKVRRWVNRVELGALTGLAGAVLYVASAFVPGSAPTPDASTTQVVAHYVDKRGQLLVAALLATIAIASLLWFLGYVKETLERAGPPGPRLATVTVAAWVVLFVIGSVGAMLSIAIIWQRREHLRSEGRAASRTTWRTSRCTR